MQSQFHTDEIARLFDEARGRTFKLYQQVILEVDLRRSPGFGFRPLLWHLAHLGVFESYWILQQVKGEPSISPRYDVIFDPIRTPREDSLELPSMSEIRSYLNEVRQNVLAFLDDLEGNETDLLLRGGYIFDLVLEHEYQHQETIGYLLQLLDPQLKQTPSDFAQREDFLMWTNASPDREMINIS